MGESVQISIQPIFKKKYLNTKTLVQNKGYKIGFKITNLDFEASPELKITGIKITSTEGNSIYHVFDDEIIIPSLFSKQSNVFWIKDRFGLIYKGSIWIELKIKATNGKIVKCFQVDYVTKEVSHNKKDVNCWGNSVYIYGDLDYNQKNTNIILITLTAVTVIFGILGTVIGIINLSK